MKTNKTVLAALIVAIAAAAGGCAAAEPASDPGAASPEIVRGLSDEALKGKLEELLADVYYVSEGDYPYVVIEGEAVTASTLTEALVRQKLAAAVLANSGDHRDIKPASCLAGSLSVDEAIADGEAAVGPEDPNDDDFGYARHDKQRGLALKTMREQLDGVVGFSFGTNDSGDQDEFGPVIKLYVGVSKTTGKLIAIMTEAVYT